MSDSNVDLKNVYNYPYFFSSLYGEQSDQGNSPLAEDLSLGEYTLCSKVKMDLQNLVRAIGNFNSLLVPNIRTIDYEKEIYSSTVGGSVNGVPFLFDALLSFLQGKADEFTLQLGTSCTVSPTYAHSIKKAYLASSVLSSDQEMSNLLGAVDPKDVLSKVNLPEKFVDMLVTHMMSSVVEKLAVNFKGSEFVMGFSLAIMEFNLQQFEMAAKMGSVAKLQTHLLELCKHTQDEVSRWLDTLSVTMENHNLVYSTGLINYDWAFEGRHPEEIERINNVRMLGNIILGNSWNEIMSSSYIRSLYLADVVYPNSQGA